MVEITKVTTLMRAPGGGAPGWAEIVAGAGNLQGSVPVKSRFGGHIDIGGSCWINNLDVDDGVRAGSIEIGQHQIGRLQEKGAFALSEGRHLGSVYATEDAQPSAIVRIPQRLRMKQSSSRTLSLTAP